MSKRVFYEDWCWRVGCDKDTINDCREEYLSGRNNACVGYDGHELTFEDGKLAGREEALIDVKKELKEHFGSCYWLLDAIVVIVNKLRDKDKYV